jgi:hypothetical protein
VAQLEAGEIRIPPHVGTAPRPTPVLPVLYVDQIAIDGAKDAAIATRDGDKKPSLPDIVPGFKANSLDVHKYSTLRNTGAPPFIFPWS